jgi:hypothetical protein
MTTRTAPRTYSAALIVKGDVIEHGGQPWRVVSGKTTKVVRTLVLRHAQLPHRARTIRPRRDAQVRMLLPIDSYHFSGS